MSKHDDLASPPPSPDPARPAALRPLADSLQAVIQTAGEGICVCAESTDFPFTRYSVWNDRMTELTGYTMAEVNRLGFVQMAFPDPDLQARVVARMQRMRAGDDLRQEEWPVVRKDGRQRVLSISTSRVDTADGPAVVALMTDVTDRRAAEARLTLAQQVAQLGSWEWDVRAGTIWWSDELYRRYGKDPAAFHPTLESYLAVVHPDDRDRVLAALTAILGSGSAITSEHRFLRPNGSVGWCHMEAVVDRDAGGMAARMWGTCQDVTDRKQAGDARQALEDRLREARRLESIGVLAAGIAHEFNNLLTTILGNAELVEAELPRASSARAYLDPIRQSGRRAAELCRQMLAYAGKGRLALAPVSLSQVGADAVAALDAGTPVELDLGPDLPPVRGDAEQLRQMVGNLLTNAAEAVAATGGKVRVATYWDRLDARAVGRMRHTPGLPAEEYVALEIRDDGPGMDDDTLARAFEPFYSTKFPGRGLGLPVVLGVLRGHGGGLDVDTAPGRGTTVRVYLPVAEGA